MFDMVLRVLAPACILKNQPEELSIKEFNDFPWSKIYEAEKKSDVSIITALAQEIIDNTEYITCNESMKSRFDPQHIYDFEEEDIDSEWTVGYSRDHGFHIHFCNKLKSQQIAIDIPEYPVPNAKARDREPDTDTIQSRLFDDYGEGDSDEDESEDLDSYGEGDSDEDESEDLDSYGEGDSDEDDSEDLDSYGEGDSDEDESEDLDSYGEGDSDEDNSEDLDSYGEGDSDEDDDAYSNDSRDTG
ncbi:hypothetical protein B0I35DRAFT_485572 [Stachybotrys elegans]|uniref:Uncharacterized protein n=1 Tax=Stachybotrys elegans TaxID=80388 RepID=A0A8K0SC24_9HYPO|nr:hypothetical protein B0I35DRAFT_485572 [Stachybotrys elegans]